MAKWEKGKSGNPSGRPMGSRNKNYLDASYWFGLAAECMEAQTPEKKMEIVKWATELIMQKIQIVPATPSDSVSNAAAQQVLLQALEKDAADTQPDPAGG